MEHQNTEYTQNPKYKENLILRLTFEFACEIVRYSEFLNDQKKFVVANQLLKSGTSIGANTKEAQNAESNNDFKHKLKIALKEADETEYWLMLIISVYNHKEAKILLEKLTSILKILNKIISRLNEKSK